MSRNVLALLAVATLAVGCGSPADPASPTPATPTQELHVKLKDGRTITCIQFGDARYVDTLYAVSCDWTAR